MSMNKIKNNFKTVNNKKFSVCINPTIINEITNGDYYVWFEKYDFLMEIKTTNNCKICNVCIKDTDKKYFTSLKKQFKTWIKRNLLYTGEIIYLNDKDLGINYESEKTRPFFIKSWSTPTYKKVVLYQITSSRGNNFKQIEIGNRIGYINTEEPITKSKYQILKYNLKSLEKYSTY